MPKGLEKILGSRIKKARDDKGISQADLAEQTGLGQGHISKLENGHFPRSDVHVIRKIASVLGVTMDSLMTGKKESILSVDEKKILDTYRPLSKDKKKEIQNYIEFSSQ